MLCTFDRYSLFLLEYSRGIIIGLGARPITDRHMAKRASLEFKGGKIEVIAALKQLFST
jgi:hypothetical protein